MPKSNKKNMQRRKKRTNRHLHTTHKYTSVAAERQQQVPVVEQQQPFSIPSGDLGTQGIPPEETSQEIATTEDGNDYFVLINFSILKSIFDAVAKCKDCAEPIILTDHLESRMGFSHCLKLHCNTCDEVQTFFTSKTCNYVQTEKPTQGRSPYEANIRAVVASREVGLGYEAIERFFSCMNMFCIANNGYQYLNQGSIYKAYMNAANMSADVSIFAGLRTACTYC